ncbi:MAG: glycosyltransferase family 4 protein [Phycisphaerae bacterium]
MKVALIIEHFDATRGGAEHFTVWLAQALAGRGHEVHVVCHDVAPRVNKYRQATQRASHDADRSHQAHPPEEVAHDGIHVHRMRGMRLNSGLGFRMFGRKARAWCEANRPAVVHSMTVAYPGDLYHPHAGVYAAIQAQAVAQRNPGREAKWKQLMLHLSGKQRTLLALERRAMGPQGEGGARRIISLCRMVTEELREQYGVDKSKIVELPNPRIATKAAFDEAALAEQRVWFRSHYKLGAGDKVAAFVGHDFRRKGLRYAIEAVAKTRDWKLIVVGLGKAREYVELANALGVGDEVSAAEGVAPRVLFVGPTKEMDTVYAAADALILPTFYDSFGLVVLEAFAHGLPVVSTEFLGAGYLVKEHGAGVIVSSPREVEGMARALEGLPARGSSEQVAMAKRAREGSAGMLPEGYLDKLEALYKDVAVK